MVRQSCTSPSSTLQYFKYLPDPKHSYYNIFKDLFIYLFIYLFIERGREKGGGINVWLSLMCPLLGTWPTTQARALDWDSNR